MSAVARMAVLDLRTVAPYRNQGFLVFGLGVLVGVAVAPARRLAAQLPRSFVPHAAQAVAERVANSTNTRRITSPARPPPRSGANPRNPGLCSASEGAIGSGFIMVP